jgi:hypothetical protein
MKAITLTQPWATLVAIGAKRVETRSWYTSYRGPLAIHASKAFPGWAKDFARQPPVSVLLGRDYEYPRGVVIATCILRNCLPTGILRPTLTAQELAFGDYSAGRYGYLLEEIMPISRPVAAVGKLGLWEWTPE